MKIQGLIAFVLTAIGAAAILQPAHAEEAPAPAPLYATVNGTPITQRDFHVAYSNYLREKFYHGEVPADQLTAAKKTVSDRLVERILLREEAVKRGIVADEKRIAQILDEYETRYATSPMWQKNRESLLPGLKQQLEEQDRLRQMETIGHDIAEPTDEAVREFHKKRIELFTEPEKMRLHTILLKVDPSAPKALWDAAREEAARIVARLRSGESSFEDMAGLHSHDRSADKGGDMGYLHLGMIPQKVQEQVQALPPGKIGDPIEVLEGIAIFRFDGRIPPKVMAYEDVAVRARDLFKRDASNLAWESFIAQLRKAATIKIIEPATPALAK